MAIVFAFILGMGVGSSVRNLLPPSPTLGFLGGGLLISIMGIIDDRVDLSWFSKLLGQIVASVVLIASVYSSSAFLLSPLGLVLSLVWVVGLTNAMNFLDNMDGISAGISSVVSLTFVGLALLQGQIETAVLAAAVCGASVGFLRFNSHPARIFLGDGGSLFLGYSLASLGLLVARPTELSISLLVPVIAVSYPIFDITFVSVTRFARGQSLTQGGKDHTSHRLARLTQSTRLTVWTIYGMCATVGAVALFLERISFTPLTIAAFVAVGLRLRRRGGPSLPARAGSRGRADGHGCPGVLAAPACYSRSTSSNPGRKH